MEVFDKIKSRLTPLLSLLFFHLTPIGAALSAFDGVIRFAETLMQRATAKSVSQALHDLADSTREQSASERTLADSNNNLAIGMKALATAMSSRSTTLEVTVKARTISQSGILAIQAPETQAVQAMGAILRSVEPLADTLREQDLIAFSRIQQEEERYHAKMIEAAIRIPSKQINDLFQVFASPQTLEECVGELSEQHGILCIPVFAGEATGANIDQQASRYYASMESAVNYINAVSGYDSVSPSTRDMGIRSERCAPPLLLKTNLLAPGVWLSDEDVAAIHSVLKHFAVICIQADRRQNSAALEVWWWLQGDDHVKSQSAPLSSLNILQEGNAPYQLLTGAAQLLLMLLCDSLSIFGFEGVSVLSWALGDTVMTRQQLYELYKQLEPWYKEMSARFARRYDDLGLIGVLQLPAPPFDKLLTDLRWSAVGEGFHVDPRGSMSGKWLFLAIAHPNLADKVYIVAILPDADMPEEYATIRYITYEHAYSPSWTLRQWQRITGQGVSMFQRNPQAFIEIGASAHVRDEAQQLLRAMGEIEHKR